MKNPPKSQHSRKTSVSNLTPRFPEITPRPSSASTVVSLEPSFSDNETVFLARTQRRRRRSVWRVVNCGLGITPLPVDLFRRVLTLVPAREVVLNCSLVCRSWLAACRDPHFWKEKCKEEGKFMPDVHGQPPKSFVMLYFKEPYTRNLLRNTHAMDGLKYWGQPRGCQIVNTEDTPEGAHDMRDYIPVVEIQVEGMKHWRDGGREPSIQSAWNMQAFVPAAERQGRVKIWVGAYYMSGLFQSVDLWKLAVPDALMDEMRPPIAVSVWCASGVLMPAWFYMTVKLRDVDSRVVMEKTEIVLYTRSSWRWRKIETTLTNYKPGVRNIYFEMGGRCNNLFGWIVQWGPEYTLPCVRFVFESQ